MSDEENIKALTVKDRWSEGIDHNDSAYRLVEMLAAMDFHHFDDYFTWKLGGDGDNGESLCYALDELIDQGLIKVEFLK